MRKYTLIFLSCALFAIGHNVPASAEIITIKLDPICQLAKHYNITPSLKKYDINKSKEITVTLPNRDSYININGPGSINNQQHICTINGSQRPSNGGTLTCNYCA
jgi:hypothetical protein